MELLDAENDFLILGRAPRPKLVLGEGGHPVCFWAADTCIDNHMLSVSRTTVLAYGTRYASIQYVMQVYKQM